MSDSQLIVMLGDSLTAGNNWEKSSTELSSKLRIVNLGLNGDNCPGVWGRLNQVVELSPDKIYLMIGINDLLQGAPAEEIVTGHLRIWMEIKECLPRTSLHILSLLPYLEAALPGLPSNLYITQINQRLAEEAEKHKLVFISLFQDFADEDLQLKLEYTSDGVHLTPKAYKLWADKLGLV